MRPRIFDTLEEMKSSDICRDKLSRYVERWDKLGFIEGLSGDTRERAALAFEQMAILMIFSAYNWATDFFEVILFSVVRRVINNIGDKFNMRTFYYLIRNNRDFIVKLYDDFQWNMITMNGMIDVEAEYTVLLTEVISDLMTSDDDWTTDDFQNAIKNKIKEFKINI
jgi:hypothetical protein